jgi:hypothetical protein
MGSTGIHLERGRKMADAVLADLDPRLTVLEHRTKRTSGEWQYVLYAAIEDRARDCVFGLVVLMHRNPSPNVYWNFAYKYVDETMGPFETDCPKAVLSLLTPTDNEYAQQWRARCQANIDNPPPKVVAGVQVHFKNALRFGDGVEAAVFTFQGRTTFRRVIDGRLVRIPNWRQNYEWSVA